MARTPAGERSPKTIKVSAEDKQRMRANPLAAAMQTSRRGGLATQARPFRKGDAPARVSKGTGKRGGLAMPMGPTGPPISAGEKTKLDAAISKAREEMAKTIDARIERVMTGNTDAAGLANTLQEIREDIAFRFERLDGTLAALSAESDLYAEAIAGDKKAGKEVADSIAGRRAARKTADKNAESDGD